MRRILVVMSITLASVGVADATHAYRTTKASWYQGRRGACGRLTGYYVAHRSLPCGTKLRVSRGSRSIVVVVRDRGPYARGRGLDLSRAAFSKLASPSQGVINVRYKEAT